MSTIEIKNLTFGYDTADNLLFDQASLNVDETWKLGLVGRNGRGKTTLLKILQGLLPYSGTVEHRLDFTYFPPKFSSEDLLTYDVCQEIVPIEQWKLEKELNLLNVSLDCLYRPFSSLSGGEKTKILLGTLFLQENSFPLIDEPTNHLDVNSRKQVADYLKKKAGFILVSHDRQFLNEVVDHIIALDKGELKTYQGNYTTYANEKKRQDEFEMAESEKIQREVKRLKNSAKEKSDWSKSRESDIHGNSKVKGSGGTGHDGFITARAARTMKRSKSIETRLNKNIAEKENLLKNLEFVDPLKMQYQPNYHDVILEVENLTLNFPGEKPLFAPLSFQLKKGESLGIMGKNGSGKTSLINAILGKFPGEIQGKISLVSPLNISYVSQNYESNQGKLKDFATANQLDYEVFLNNLKKLGMERDVFQNTIENMSMGQQKKVEVAKSLSQLTELYIWDEPLNYLDTYNQDQLTEVINSVKPTLLYIEHDENFPQEIHSKTIYLEKL